MLDKGSSNVEEIERDTYRGKDIWSITLSISRDFDPFGLAHLSVEPLQYKRFLIGAETGELLAMRLRDVVSQ
jgi:hypothetical protein